MHEFLKQKKIIFLKLILKKVDNHKWDQKTPPPGPSTPKIKLWLNKTKQHGERKI